MCSKVSDVEKRLEARHNRGTGMRAREYVFTPIEEAYFMTKVYPVGHLIPFVNQKSIQILCIEVQCQKLIDCLANVRDTLAKNIQQ